MPLRLCQLSKQRISSNGVEYLLHKLEFWCKCNILKSTIGTRVLKYFKLQVMAYLLISSASAAIPVTNQMREGLDNIFTDSSAAAISMSFLAFLSLALSAMVSGHKLSTQSYI